MRELNIFLIRSEIFKQVRLFLENIVANDLIMIKIKNIFERFFIYTLTFVCIDKY